MSWFKQLAVLTMLTTGWKVSLKLV